MPSISILMVEDNPINLAIGVAMLQSLGAEVQTAATAAEARAKLTSGKRFALLMLDIQLPDGTGHEVAREYVAMGGRAPILFLSSPERVDDVDDYAHQKSGFLAKPFTLRQLQEAIDSVL